MSRPLLACLVGALLVGASQGLLLCIVILSLPSANAVANRLLVLYVGLESLHLFFLYLSYLDATSAPPPLLRFLCSIRVLDGPAVAIVEVQREIVLPTGPIDLRGVARPAGEAASSSPAAPRARRGRKASPSPAKKPRRPRRKE